MPVMVPVRLSNNDRCQVSYEVGKEVPYCINDMASLYGIKNQCADAISPASTDNVLCNESSCLRR